MLTLAIETNMPANAFVHAAMLGWIPIVIALFGLMPARRALLTSFVLSWLFLPMVTYELPMVPDYSKISATCVGSLLGVMWFDLDRLKRFRPRWFDWPMLIWCLCPMASSLTNGLGPKDGFGAAADHLLNWGVPYLLGRIYFTDLASVRELALAVFYGGLIYVPLCLFEVRFSPHLHAWVYGYHPHQFAQTIRFGGFRPTVFMKHGLMVGMWMSMATLVGVWLWSSGGLRRCLGVPGWIPVGVLGATAVLCKSTGALLLLVLGLAVLAAIRFGPPLWHTFASFVLIPGYALMAGAGRTTRNKFERSSAALGEILTRASLVAALALMLALPVSYTLARGLGLWSGQAMVSLSASLIDANRAQSLDFRLQNESMLAAKAMRQPLFGWGGWGRSRVTDEWGNDVSTTDGLWIITLGQKGVVGLGAMLIWMSLPLAMLLRRCPPRFWVDPRVAPLAALALVTQLYLIDNLLNDMQNPWWTLAAGAACAAAGSPRRKPVAESAPVVAPSEPEPAVA